MRLLSHYTNRTGLEGITRSQSLWATNFLDLNDNTEFFYAWAFIQCDAFRQIMTIVPDAIKRPNYDIEAASRSTLEQFRNGVRAGDGYGQLYVTSFARGSTDDHQQRGILTIWDRYTHHEGYCLQFDRNDLEHMIQLESYRANYVSIELAAVKYGVDKSSQTYRDLTFQLSQNLLRQLLQAGHKIPAEPNWKKMWAESTLTRALLNFCAIHKDPCFEDEREVRLFCCPAPNAEARVFTGLASAPRIHTTLGGKRYLILGDKWRPGVRPRRIIVGTRANHDISDIISMYDTPPKIAYAKLPIAAL